MTRKKILLVDDQNTVLMMERMMLTPTGHELLSARDGEEAVRKAMEEHPDLILLDVIMPKLDGFEALKQLREHQATKATPVLMVTTRGESINVESGYAAGCNDYITKPFNAVELLAKVKGYLGG